MVIAGCAHHLTQVTPGREDSLAKGIGSTHLKYTRYINRLHGLCGHLWQDRFFSSPLGSDSFVSKLERVVGRRLRPLPVGRPKANRKTIKSSKQPPLKI